MNATDDWRRTGQARTAWLILRDHEPSPIKTGGAQGIQTASRILARILHVSNNSKSFEGASNALRARYSTLHRTERGKPMKVLCLAFADVAEAS